MSDGLARLRIRVRGLVQGVGFRPFVYREARALGLAGWVRNDGEGVLLEVQGAPAGLACLKERLRASPPPMAQVDRVDVEVLAPTEGCGGFAIIDSQAGRASTGITPDAATCPDCLAELFEPTDRRYRYPFINCTDCGPRFTITGSLPYDRPHTSMAGFSMCPACQAEFTEPADRRFHAQPNACPACGPAVRLLDAHGAVEHVTDPIERAVRLLAGGAVLAIKGLGGFHLACDARHAGAVARLRERKRREEKPFAVMAANVGSLAGVAAVGEPERRLLESRERPVVLVPKADGCDEDLAGVAPGIGWLGTMLPYTPLHYLLFHEAAGRPEGCDWLSMAHTTLLVMTSANPNGEPLVIDNEEAVRRLAGIADGFLVHDRPILIRCDDSVTRSGQDGPRFLRRARGWTPSPIHLRDTGPSVLALGGHYKNTVCLTRGAEAFVSQHVGDLDNPASCRFLDETVRHLVKVLEIEPEYVAHDLHPELFSTRAALELADDCGITAIAVQHHHAHIAAVMAEHGLEGPVIGLALDGIGLGADGEPWGGEMLLVDGADMERIGHLGRLPLPGGDRAAREPWRMAAAVLHRLGREEEVFARLPYPGAAAVLEVLARGVHSPWTSSAGRWFDAAAGLLGVCRAMSFEGQAGMLLEGMAEAHGPVEPLQDGFLLRGDGVLDLLPLMERLLEIGSPGAGAALFHATLAEALATWLLGAVERTGVRDAVLGGGCFLNDILHRNLRARLEGSGLAVWSAQKVPPNDGGISLGQAWVARKIAMQNGGTR